MAIKQLIIQNLRTAKKYQVTEEEWKTTLKRYHSRFAIVEERVVRDVPGPTYTPKEVSEAAKAAIKAMESSSATTHQFTPTEASAPVAPQPTDTMPAEAGEKH